MSLSERELRQVREAAVRAIDHVFAVLAASAAREPETKPSLAPILAPEPSARPRMAYTVKEAAALLGLSRGTLYKLIAEGRLTSMRVGSRRLFRETDLKASLEDI